MGVEVDISTAGDPAKAAQTTAASQPAAASSTIVNEGAPEQNQPIQDSAVLVQSPPIKAVQPSTAAADAQSAQPVPVTPTPIEVRPDQTKAPNTAATAGQSQNQQYPPGAPPLSRSPPKKLRYHKTRDLPLIHQSSITRGKGIRYRNKAAYFRQRGLKYADKARYHPNKAKHYLSLSEYYLGQSNWYREQSDRLIAESDRQRPKEHAIIVGNYEGIQARKRIHRNKIRHALGLHTYGPY